MTNKASIPSFKTVDTDSVVSSKTTKAISKGFKKPDGKTVIRMKSSAMPRVVTEMEKKKGIRDESFWSGKKSSK